MKPSNIEIAKVFNNVASRYDSITSSYAIRRRMEFFVTYAEGKCLEVGAGTGVISKMFAELGHEVIATDISPNMMDEIKKKGLSAVVCDAEQLPFPDASFDTVLASEVLYYLDNPDRFLQEARRVLKPGGVLLLSSANARVARLYDWLRSILRPFGVSGTYFNDPLHTFYSEKELRRLVENAGFGTVETKKILIFPVSVFDFVNKILERTPLRHASAFVMLSARK